MNESTTAYECTVRKIGKRWFAYVYHTENGQEIADYTGMRAWVNPANAQGEALEWAEENLPDGSH